MRPTFADTITVGRQKSSGTLNFNSAFSNSNPKLFLRGQSAERVATLAIGDNSPQSVSGSSASGVVDLSGGTANVMADMVWVGRGQTGNGGGSATGTLTLSSGTFDVNTLEVGYQNSATAGSVVTGAVNVNGTAILIVNTSLRLARQINNVSNFPAGNLNIHGGTVTGAGNISAGGGNATLVLNGGTLSVTGAVGTLSAPINVVALTNSTLRFSVTSSLTNLTATTLITGGAANTINIASLPVIVSSPVQFALIKYGGTIGGAGFNFTLGALPGGAACGGYLSNNTANSSVDLVLTNCATPDAFLTWNGDVNGNWDTLTENWK